jgi:hypothetical protein
MASHNDGHKYLPNATDAFSKYAYSVPMRSKTGEAVASAFRSIFPGLGEESRWWCERKRGKGCVKAKFRQLLDGKEIEMTVRRNPDVKCAIVDRFKWTLKSKLYKSSTWKYTSPYVDALDKFISGYNNPVHSSTGKGPSLVSDKDVLRVWARMRKRQARIRKVRSPPIYSVGQTENWQGQDVIRQMIRVVFKTSKVLRNSPRHVYEMEDLSGESIDGQFYIGEDN